MSLRKECDRMCFRNNCLPNIEKERLFRRLRATKCLLRKSLAAGALCRHTSDVLLRFPEASLPGEIPFQGLFSQGECIPAQRNLPSGIIFPRRTLCPQSCTDLSRIRRTQANVYQSYLISWRTASFASSAAPEAGTVIPSCTPHYGRNLPVFFPERG